MQLINGRGMKFSNIETKRSKKHQHSRKYFFSIVLRTHRNGYSILKFVRHQILNPDIENFYDNQSIKKQTVLWWRSGFDLSLVIRDPEIESRCRTALQGRCRDHSSQEASLILK